MPAARPAWTTCWSSRSTWRSSRRRWPAARWCRRTGTECRGRQEKLVALRGRRPQLVLLARPLALDAAGGRARRGGFDRFEASNALARHAAALAFLDQAEVRFRGRADEAHGQPG